MTWRQSALIEHSAHGDLRGDGSPATSSFAALRTANNLYVEYASGERELYDLNDDPFELENLIGRGDQGLIQALSARLAAMSVCTGEMCRTVEDAPLPGESRHPATMRSAVSSCSARAQTKRRRVVAGTAVWHNPDLVRSLRAIVSLSTCLSPERMRLSCP